MEGASSLLQGPPSWSGRRRQVGCFSMRVTWFSSLRCGEPTTATKAQGTPKMLSMGKTPAPPSEDLKSPMMGSGPKREAAYNANFCSHWARMLPSTMPDISKGES